jgi:hypothetical protein
LPDTVLGVEISMITIDDRIEKLTFQKQPNSISATYRPMYRIAEILLSIRHCGKRKTLTVLKLQLISWIAHDVEASSVIKKLMDKQTIFKYMHIDPSVNLAIDYAIGSRLIEITSAGRIRLTTLGGSLLDSMETEEVMSEFTKKLISINIQIKDLRNDQL